MARTSPPRRLSADLAEISLALGVVGIASAPLSWFVAIHASSLQQGSVRTSYGLFLLAAAIAIAGFVCAVTAIVTGSVARRRLRAGWEYHSWEATTGLVAGACATVPCLLLAAFGLFAYSIQIEF
jgi:4-amino-4-deoxy-L-arabinose transferase-like glycosyltransferase